MRNIEPRTCKNCHSELKKVDHESRARFEKKKFCSNKCGREWLKANRQGWWQYKGDTATRNDEVELGRQKYLAMRGGEL